MAVGVCIGHAAKHACRGWAQGFVARSVSMAQHELKQASCMLHVGWPYLAERTHRVAVHRGKRPHTWGRNRRAALQRLSTWSVRLTNC